MPVTIAMTFEPFGTKVWFKLERVYKDWKQTEQKQQQTQQRKEESK